MSKGGMSAKPKDKMAVKTNRSMAKEIPGKKTEPDVTPARKAHGAALARKLSGKRI